MKYGLIGAELKHSFSKGIHERLADYTYELYPLQEEAFHTFMKEKNFTAINVTIPYKIKAMAYLDHIDEKAKHIGAVNTILHKNDKLYGTNTDYDGFRYLLNKHGIKTKNQHVLVLGDGGAAQAIKAVLRDEGCTHITSVRRQIDANTVTYEQAKAMHPDVSIIINTTPCGMYPDNTSSPCDLRDFPMCKAYVDIVYNPLYTQACIQAKTMGIAYAGGLEMLIAQAKYAVEFFCETKISDACIDEIYQDMIKEKSNLVLIGMPSCGKTTIAKTLAQVLQRPYIDLDEELVKRTDRSIKDIILQDGEAAFRKAESALCSEFSKQQGLIIATGGGIIKNADNMHQLAMNGVVIYIKRALDQLLVDEERPLSSDKEAIAALYQERKSLYETYADITIDNDADIDTASKRIIKAWNTYIKEQN